MCSRKNNIECKESILTPKTFFSALYIFKWTFGNIFLYFGLIMPMVPILESKSQNGTQIFKSLKMVPFFVETFDVCPCR